MMTTKSDLEGFRRDGAAAQQAGASVFDNPVGRMAPSTYGAGGGWNAWIQAYQAWWAGWLEEDRGRDLDVKRMRDFPYW